jgi:hypothetical protein
MPQTLKHTDPARALSNDSGKKIKQVQVRDSVEGLHPHARSGARNRPLSDQWCVRGYHSTEGGREGGRGRKGWEGRRAGVGKEQARISMP